MTHPISTCIWFDKQAQEAADLYATIFPDFKAVSSNPLAVVYDMGGRRFMHLNGGPGYPVNPSISFFVSYDSEEEIRKAWDKLIEGGKALMPLDTYPWSAKYGWVADKYGVNWQLMMGHQSGTRIVPSLMFTQHNAGKLKEALAFYTSLFDASAILAMSLYEKGEPDIEGNIKYSQILLNGLPFSAMESTGPHPFIFNEGVSFVITVDTQEEIDRYWDALVKEGQPGKCGWLKDKYGVSWQIVPTLLGKLMTNPDTAPKAAYAFLQMSKLIIADLEKAVH
jgi:predicted 3-demethylubiquinone-9 3-methyltransferase (glyoxalase superfamily)